MRNPLEKSSSIIALSLNPISESVFISAINLSISSMCKKVTCFLWTLGNSII